MSWSAAWNEEAQMYYYYNEETEETTWDKPDGCDHLPGPEGPPPDEGADDDDIPENWIVADQGQFTTKVGFSGDDAPTNVVRESIVHSTNEHESLATLSMADVCVLDDGRSLLAPQSTRVMMVTGDLTSNCIRTRSSIK